LSTNTGVKPLVQESVGALEVVALLIAEGYVLDG
jgi:hypothetical protein